MQRYSKEIPAHFLCMDVELCDMSGPLMMGKVVVQGSGAVTPRCGYQWLLKGTRSGFARRGGHTLALFM
jgi:hypothetical protein